jgi:hypothetical protein
MSAAEVGGLMDIGSRLMRSLISQDFSEEANSRWAVTVFGRPSSGASSRGEALTATRPLMFFMNCKSWFMNWRLISGA